VRSAIKKLSLVKGLYLITKKGDPFPTEVLAKYKVKALKKQSQAIKVLNTQTNEIREFNSQTDAGRFLEVTKAAIGYAIKNFSLVKSIYLITKGENLFEALAKNRARISGAGFKREAIPVKVLNTQTGAVIEYKSQSEAGKSIGVTTASILKAIKKGNKIKGIYLIIKK